MPDADDFEEFDPTGGQPDDQDDQPTDDDSIAGDDILGNSGVGSNVLEDEPREPEGGYQSKYEVVLFDPKLQHHKEAIEANPLWAVKNAWEDILRHYTNESEQIEMGTNEVLNLFGVTSTRDKELLDVEPLMKAQTTGTKIIVRVDRNNPDALYTPIGFIRRVIVSVEE